ncbi:hypothetical protein CCACVL1_19034 [Corchorus capsularis]|uniref:Uncharacterized protein n=1 Tax=Corchorus capsularis TaxID=210143 RepID=A0A1R3HIU1_COCAP|nr:hypothetical protein CCACVL1_19034 [Corchorus capsularis]
MAMGRGRRMAEISLCRVYKRAGVEDHPSLPRCLPTRPSARGGQQSDKKYNPQEAAHQQAMERTFQAFGGQSSSHSQQMEIEKLSHETTDGSSSTSTSDVTTALGLSKQNNPQTVYRPMAPPPINTTLGLPIMEEDQSMFLNQSKQALVPPNCTTLFSIGSSSVSSNVVDDLHRLQLSLNMLPGSLPTAFSDRLWEWNPIPEANREFNNPFK